MTFFITRILPIYYGILGLISVLTTFWDKLAAKRRAWRVPERDLMLLGLFGGALPMYIAMLLIRHKTRHKKFMIGLPVFILLHIALAALLIYYGGIW
ncbi:MAG: DUF1294 domain-containing protein [Clostridiales bacterium]|nr:DUF1294 domain-containing protein [Clostridiales bacterium]